MATPQHALSYPVGEFDISAPVTPAMRAPAIDEIAALPTRVRNAVKGLTDAQLDTPYRPGGWTVRQVVHHIADSHMNGFIRVRLSLTETTPTIKPYDEKLWANLADMKLPVDSSLEIIDGLHTRWAALYRTLTSDDFARTFFHPEMGRTMALDTHLQMYAWHCRHHVAHITSLRTREGW
jgi:hypothetical protein